ncbi:phage tail tip lysozyme [Methylobacterium terricola]|uniref:phage tail tip lysozyme n=1 Tax=Methylobacterium terricola TaxID=2583531 RepID=UPI001487338A|nr:phage tail tip lysozyme [Methylobacterium terricola]
MTPQFKAAVETYGPRFMTDLGLDKLKVAGIFGNLAVESAQFTALQEYKPVVAGSRGGWGWAQWTGPRRRAFEAWAAEKGFRLDNPEAFYGYMLVELRGAEVGALTALRATTTLDRATEVFMLKYERPGVPHLDKRKAYALEALRVLEAALAAREAVKKDLGLTPAPALPTPPHVDPAGPLTPMAPTAARPPVPDEPAPVSAATVTTGGLWAAVKSLFAKKKAA